MENYMKGEVKELEDKYTFNVDDVLQMRITQGSKIRNVMGFALKKMGDKDIRQITWNGSGQSVSKTITCAEIMKRKLKGLHQITKIRYKRIEEHWTPRVEGLEPLKVNRDIPAISILLSKDPLDTAEPGYQQSGNFEAFWQERKSAAHKNRRSQTASSRKSGGPYEQKNKGRKYKPDKYKPDKKSLECENVSVTNNAETSDKMEGTLEPTKSSSKE